MIDNKKDPCFKCEKKDCDKFYIDDLKKNLCWECYWETIKGKENV